MYWLAHSSHLRTIFFSISLVFLIGKVGTLSSLSSQGNPGSAPEVECNLYCKLWNNSLMFPWRHCLFMFFWYVWPHVYASKCAFHGVVLTRESFKSQNYIHVWLMFSLGIVSEGFATISVFLRLKSLKCYAVNSTWLLNIYVDLSFLGVKFRKLSDIVITFLLITGK